MKHESYWDGDTLTIELQGTFTFSDNQAFRQLIQLTDSKPTTSMRVDLSKLEFIDSSALGMLLLLKDTTEEKNISLTLEKPQGQIKKIFEFSKFYSIFDIND